MDTKNMVKKCVAEALGTLVLVLVGCGTAVIVGCSGPDGVLVTALAFGLSLSVMAYAVGPVSGCHINPAVSLAVYLTGGMSLTEMLFYMLSQIIGAFAGSGLLALFTGQASALGQNTMNTALKLAVAGAPVVEVGIGTAIIVEVVLTFIFVLAVLGATTNNDNKGTAGVAVGFALTLVHILGIGFTGTSVNPARSLAPAVICGGEALSQVWIFIVAPLAGAAIAAAVHSVLHKKAAK